MEETIKIQRTETEENRKQRYCDYERALKQLRKRKLLYSAIICS